MGICREGFCRETLLGTLKLRENNFSLFLLLNKECCWISFLYLWSAKSPLSEFLPVDFLIILLIEFNPRYYKNSRELKRLQITRLKMQWNLENLWIVTFQNFPFKVLVKYSTWKKHQNDGNRFVHVHNLCNMTTCLTCNLTTPYKSR